jgi:hypothetical protein
MYSENIKKHTLVKKIKRKALPYLRKNIILEPLSYDKLPVKGKTEKSNFNNFTKNTLYKGYENGKTESGKHKCGNHNQAHIP